MAELQCGEMQQIQSAFIYFLHTSCTSCTSYARQVHLFCFLLGISFLELFAMRWIKSLLWLYGATAFAQSTEGIYNLVKRRLPEHLDSFRFTLDTNLTGDYDAYVVTSAANGTIFVKGNSLSALSSGYGLSTSPSSSTG